MTSRKSVAIIGSGIAGLYSAWQLHKEFDVTVYEKENKLGGHTDTHEFEIDGRTVRIDSGFIVFCRDYYPHFCGMLNQFGVESQPTSMSFSAHNAGTGLVYNATSINRLFCQRRNLVNPGFYRMLLDLVRFYRTAPAVLETDDHTTTVGDWLQQHRYSEQFMRDHLFPMISALWSATPERVSQFPIRHLVEFLHRHGMMNLVFRPEWRVVKNGSDSYIAALQNQLPVDWKTGCAVSQVARAHDHVTVITADGQRTVYDAVIFAVHSDQALAILESPSADEARILDAIPYERNHVVIHTDESIMHPMRSAWASWNTEVPSDLNATSLRCCTANYWMNLLQGLPLKTNVFTTLNSHHRIDPDKILAERYYAHPVFTASSVAAQRELTCINGTNRSYFAGAYWGWGFHEDGARSAAQSCTLLREQLG